MRLGEWSVWALPSSCFGKVCIWKHIPSVKSLAEYLNSDGPPGKITLGFQSCLYSLEQERNLEGTEA